MGLAETYVASHVWAITEEKLRTIYDVASRDTNLEAVEKALGRQLENSYDVTVRDGVARIPIHGVISRKANFFIRVSGGVSTELLARDITAAVNDPYIKAIILDFDSPGGEASGVNELAKMIRSYRGTKPIVAYGSGTVASAAYWLACSTDKIVVDETALVGSVGVLLTVKKGGSGDSIEIVNSQSPNKMVNPETDHGRQQLETLADSLGAVFLQSVSDHRGLDLDYVLENFGRGSLVVGKEAVDRKMADEIGSFEGVLASLTNNKEKPRMSAELTQQIGKLTAELAEANQIINLSDAEKAFMAKLSDKTAFLAASPDVRRSLMAEAETSDPVVYTSRAGVQYRRSSNQELLQAVKTSDELQAKLEAMKSESELFTQKAWAAEHLNHFVGTESLVALARLAIENPDVATSLKAANDSLGLGFREIGTTSSPEKNEIEALVDRHQKANPGSTRAQAYAATLATEEGRKLYAQAQF